MILKKPILLLLCLGAILLGTWFLLSLPRQEVVDTTLTGYRFSPEGEGRPCTLEIQGSYTSHRFSPEKDTFSPGYDGGFWLDGKKLSLMHVGFPDDEKDWIQGSAQDDQAETVDYVVYRELKTLVLLTTLEEETVLAVFPAASRKEALSILENLPETQTKIQTFPTA